MSVRAQMFSLGDREPQQDRRIGLLSMIGVSWEVADFSYQGDGLSQDERLDFSNNILRLRFDSPGLDIGMGFGGGLTGMNQSSYFNLIGRLNNSFAIKRSPSFLLLIPIQITSDLLQVRANQSNADFTQSSLSVGTGLSTIFKLGDALTLNLRATPNYGFSFSQGSLFGGSLFRFDAQSMIYIHNVFGSHSLAIGYNFDHRSYNIEENLNDYDYTSHSITIGYAF